MASTWITLAYKLLFAVLFLCVMEKASCRKRTKILIATIIPSDRKYLFSKEKVSPAIDVALRQAKILGLLKCCEITVKYSDSKCNGKDAPIQAFGLYKDHGSDNTMLFMGPVCDYALAPVARYSIYWNVPVISPGGFAHDFGVDKSLPGAEFPILTRVGATFDKLTEAIISMIKFHKWRKIKVIYDPLALSDISPKFCYLAAGAIIHYMKNDSDVHQDFHLLNSPNFDVEYVLRNEVGPTHAGKSYKF